MYKFVFILDAVAKQEPLVIYPPAQFPIYWSEFDRILYILSE